MKNIRDLYLILTDLDTSYRACFLLSDLYLEKRYVYIYLIRFICFLIIIDISFSKWYNIITLFE